MGEATFSAPLGWVGGGWDAELGIFVVGDAGVTSSGGIAVRLTNGTGFASVKGTLVRTSTAADNAFIAAPASSDEAIGVVYEAGVANGQPCWVVISGRCQVLLKNSTAATRGNWVQVSNAEGRADATLDNPNPATHWGEVGHCMETAAGGTDVLVWINAHFN